MRSRTVSQATATTEQTLAVELEPADMGAAGRLLSPVWTVMASMGRPRRSLAVMAMTVRMPVPISWVPVSTVAWSWPGEDSVRVRRQSAGPTWVG